jgi:hypothetical protein
MAGDEPEQSANVYRLPLDRARGGGEDAGAGGGPARWQLQGPDAEDLVWLDWTGAGPPQRLLLGTTAEVGEALADFLARVDYGD